MMMQYDILPISMSKGTYRTSDKTILQDLLLFYLLILFLLLIIPSHFRLEYFFFQKTPQLFLRFCSKFHYVFFLKELLFPTHLLGTNSNTTL